MKFERADRVAVIEAYGLYLLTGMLCACVWASLTSLMKHFQITMAMAAALASAFAAGRVATVFLCGYITEKLGARFAVCAGVGAVAACTGILPMTQNYGLGLGLMALSGFGMGVQDSACPILLLSSFKSNYSSAMSAGQAFFGAGCFLPPFLMSVLLSVGLSWKWMYYTVFFLAVALLLGTPFMRIGKPEKSAHSHHGAKVQSEKNIILLFVPLLVTVFVYFANCNIFHTYTSPYVMHFGAAEAVSVNVLTMYSVGAVIGSLLFIPILKKMHTTSVVMMNTILVVIFLAVAMQLKSTVGFFIFFTLTGVFNGVLFSVLVTISTELMPSHAAMAASLLGFVGGGAEILTPLITGLIVNASDIEGVFSYNLGLVSITCLSAAALKVLFIWGKKRGSI